MANLNFPTVGEQLRRIDDGHSVAGPSCVRITRPGDFFLATVKIVLHLFSCSLRQP